MFWLFGFSSGNRRSLPVVWRVARQQTEQRCRPGRIDLASTICLGPMWRVARQQKEAYHGGDL
jgi:hypothetical protein